MFLISHYSSSMANANICGKIFKRVVPLTNYGDGKECLPWLGHRAARKAGGIQEIRGQLRQSLRYRPQRGQCGAASLFPNLSKAQSRFQSFVI
jgi:hypothetical protein